MKHLLLASVGVLLGMASQASALTLPPTYAPTPLTSNSHFAQGITGTVSGQYRSPFDTTTTPNNPYDVVYGSNGLYGIGATFNPTAFGGSSGAAGIFTFVDGSPDSYNVLVFNLVGGGTKVYKGAQINAQDNGVGVSVVTLTNIGAYNTVSFGSEHWNSFEFAALLAVPLPASLPMFGGALLALAGFGYAMNRWVAPNRQTAA